MSRQQKVSPAKAKVSTWDNITPQHNNHHPIVNQQRAKDVWVLLLAFRCINALCVRTFFQPDEYFQSLEPAWQMTFGPDSGAWITWEWHHQLRCSLHPALFAIIYYVVDKPMELLNFFPQFRAFILAVLPNIVQAYFAAAGDFYTWQLSERIYGVGSGTSLVTLAMTVLSPWQWFCSTRTLSNCLETTLTIAALNFWPWKISSDSELGPASASEEYTDFSTTPATEASQASEAPTALEASHAVKHLRTSLLLAGTACILRPTNALIWFCILMPALSNFFSQTSRLTNLDYLRILRETIFCGLTVLAISALSDRLYFKEWTFPPYQWLNFNISQDLAVFYGRNDWHYYISQGLPLLLTTYLPFTLIAFWKFTSQPPGNILFLLTTTIFVTLSVLSLISHKEVRFIYPLLPLLHIVTAPIISNFFLPGPQSDHTKIPSKTRSNTNVKNKLILVLLLTLNILIAVFTTQIHQSGVLSVMTYLRHQYETTHLHRIPESPLFTTTPYTQPFAGFLMPCHSTPWRSQLYHPALKAWALTCEPPLHIPAHTPERASYRDEADRFYDDPLKFLSTEIGAGERPWPELLVGFEGIEGSLKEFFNGQGGEGRSIREKWRTTNSWVHDDWRRKGDVVVWEIVDKEGS